MRHHRSAFTLIELLVVIAIIGVLMGLLLPAVQMAREAARRATCLNNLKQFGIALNTYHVDYNGFPLGRTISTAGSFSPHARMLPYFEQGNVFASLNFDVDCIAADNATAYTTSLSFFVCPSDPRSQNPFGWGGTNYRSNEGTSLVMWYGDTDTAGVNTNMPAPNGLFFANLRCGAPDVTDGLSNTAAFSEHVKGDFDNNLATESADTFWPQTYPSTPDQAISQCRAIDWRNLKYQRVSSVGAPWVYGYHSTTSYWHSGPPNSRSCMFPPARIMTTANSGHSGGVNLLLTDGSVRFVRNSVNRDVWRAVGTRNGAEVLGNESF